MKVYVVKCMDTNFVSSIDKIFINRQDAENYATTQAGKYEFVTFMVTEYQVFNEVTQCSFAI